MLSFETYTDVMTQHGSKIIYLEDFEAAKKIYIEQLKQGKTTFKFSVWLDEYLKNTKVENY